MRLPLPPPTPIRTKLNWDIFEDRSPPPPLLQLGQNAFEFFEFKFRSLYAKTVIEDSAGSGLPHFGIKLLPFINNENHDIATAMSPSRADPALP